MAGGSIEVEGITELGAALERIALQANAATRTATAASSHYLEGEVKKTLGSTSHPKGTPTPSAPGDPPSLITGTLRRSVKATRPVSLGYGRWESTVGPTAVYGRIQELGGTTGRNQATRLPPRPFVQPSYDRAVTTGAMIRAYHTAWRAALH